MQIGDERSQVNLKPTLWKWKWIVVLKSQCSVNLVAQQIGIERNLEEMKRDTQREKEPKAEKSE